MQIHHNGDIHNVTAVRMGIIKKTRNKKFWKGHGERESFHTLSGNVNQCSHHGSLFKN